jgi:phosphoribosylformylglycinamidine synthase
VVGLLDEIDRLVGPAFRDDGDAVLLLGTATPGLAGSEYARLAGLAPEDGPPVLDLAQEAGVQRLVRAAIARGLLRSAQDVAAGGLAVALAECAIWGGRGATLRLAVASSPAVDLFGESPSRIVVACRERDVPELVRLAEGHGVPVELLGTVGGERLVVELAGAGATGAAEERGSRVADSIEVAVEELERVWQTGLARALGWDEAA